MPTGRGNGKAPKSNRAAGLRFAGGKVVVEFTDGREVSIPLAFYPSLLRATPSQRADWELIGPGKGFHWRQLDLDLSVAGLIEGLREAIPRPPAIPARRSAVG